MGWGGEKETYVNTHTQKDKQTEVRRGRECEREGGEKVIIRIYRETASRRQIQLIKLTNYL